jgi:hypothetical protein
MWNSELQAALHKLSEESMKTTRRLDDLYYTLLEKLSGLHTTINNMQELSGLTARLHGQFRTETSELTSDLQKQIDGFAGFKAQRGKIQDLDIRVKESKEKADGLSERLEAARKGVSALEKREKQYQDSISCGFTGRITTSATANVYRAFAMDVDHTWNNCGTHPRNLHTTKPRVWAWPCSERCQSQGPGEKIVRKSNERTTGC